MIGLDFVGGVLWLVSGLAVAVREIVLNPKMGSWPDTGPTVRAAMFICAVTFLYRGVELMCSASDGSTDLTPAAVAALVALAIYNVALLVNLLRQVLPPRVWDRLKRLQRLAFCPPRGRLALLSLAGFQVVPPWGSPQELEESTDASVGRGPRLPQARKVPRV